MLLIAVFCYAFVFVCNTILFGLLDLGYNWTYNVHVYYVQLFIDVVHKNCTGVDFGYWLIADQYSHPYFWRAIAGSLISYDFQDRISHGGSIKQSPERVRFKSENREAIW